MKITTEKNETTCVLLVEGTIDTLTAPELENAVLNAGSECENLVLDLGGVQYISSAGIRVLIGAHKQMGGDHFALRNVTPNVMDVLKLTGFLNIITIE